MKKENKYKDCSKTRVLMWVPGILEKVDQNDVEFPCIDNIITEGKYFKEEEDLATILARAKKDNKYFPLVGMISGTESSLEKMYALANKHKFDALVVSNARKFDLDILTLFIVALRDYNIWVRDLMTGFDSRETESIDVLVHALACRQLPDGCDRDSAQKPLVKGDESISELVKKREDCIKREYFSDFYGIKAE